MTTLIPPCQHAVPSPGCAFCARASGTSPEDRDYQRLWAAQAQGVPSPDLARLRRPCRHGGAETGEQVPCPKCPGNVRIKLLACAVHGRRTALKQVPGVMCCQGGPGTPPCPDYDPFEPFGAPVRDLAYHVYPLRSASHVWRWNVRQLLRRISLFNGRRVVALSVDAKTEPVGEVMDAFGGEVDPGDFVVVENEPGAPEAKTLPLLLGRLETSDPDRVLLRAHAKGVTHEHDDKGPVVREWVETLYEAMLDYFPAVEAQLVHYPITGCFRCNWRQWPREAPASGWFYSGSWFWARSRHLFARAWRQVPRFWSTVEAMPSLLFAPEEAGCLFADNCGVAYNADAWRQLRPAFDRWAAARARECTKTSLSQVNAERCSTQPVDNKSVTDVVSENGENIPNGIPGVPQPHVVTVITENYIPRARPFLASLALARSARRWVICNGFNPGPLAAEFPYLTFRRMEASDLDSFGMSQFGRWLDVLPEVRDTDVVVLSDADVVCQRDLAAAERALLAGLPDDVFAAAWNAGPGDDLAAEADRIGLADRARWGPLSGVAVVNCGVLAMRASAWRRLRELYEARAGEFYRRTSHRCRCQWLVCWCLRVLGLRHVLLDAATHAHGHFSIPPGVTFAGGAALAGATPVLFRHCL
jgi:hypothetical protein